MVVARVKLMKQETVNLTNIRDVEDLICENMGEDIWLAAQNFIKNREGELEEEVRYLKEDLTGNDGQLYALRTTCRDNIEILNSTIKKIREAKRLDRDSIIRSLLGVIGDIEESEGYL